MKNRNDLIIAIFLILILVIAIYIGNAAVQGLFLSLFSGVLIFHTALRTVEIPKDKFKKKFFFGVLLFFEFVLSLAAVCVIISAFLEV